ncbi:MAG: enoyl-CoA hydratase/isomerase family protein [Candidatus Sericytochromatia bacterium]
MHTDYHTLRLEVLQQIALVQLGKDGPATASLELVQELDRLFQEIELAGDVRAVILTGHSDVFLKAWAPSGLKSLDAIAAAGLLDYLRQVLAQVGRCSKPVIAAVNGQAAGLGFELALACHVLLAADEARFSLPETSLGFLPLGGGLQRLLRHVGRGRALEIVLGGYQLTARDAYEWGLVNHLFSDSDLLDKARDMARLFNSKAPLAVRQALRAAVQGEGLPLEPALELETQLNAFCWNSSDLQEGIQAALEQRPPIFRAR